MEIRELEAFLAVMSAGSITGAARLLDRSQSQVTRLIQDLETSLGFPLFDRNGPRITPSDKGVAFHAEAERFISGIEHLRNRAQHAGHRAKRRICFFESTDSVKVPKQLVGTIEQVNNHSGQLKKFLANCRSGCRPFD